MPAISLHESSEPTKLSEPAESKEDIKPQHERILSRQMINKSVKDLNDNNFYQLGFARKRIMHTQFPFTHSAAAFLELNNETEAKWLIFGRQTPFFLKPNAEEAKHYVGGISNLVHNLTNSKIDNEKNYSFFPKQNFEVELTNVTLTGSEVRQIIERADYTICKNQMFNLVQSNCYSASVSVLAYAIEAIAHREERTVAEHENNNRSIAIIRELLTHATQDNFSIGVITHPLVIKHLKKVDSIIAERNTSNPPPLEQQEAYESRVSSDEDSEPQCTIIRAKFAR